tara:strand:- start:26313 stop:29807 length:3495 start_codon:yes stop_codon:yes gene_type:complete
MKVRIKKLPKGFSVRDGHVMKNKSHGGSHTGDQESFGLVTLPSPYTNDITSGNFNNPFGDVNTSLKAVPREEANLEAEVGETVLTDMNNDGDFELYNIGGKRHHKGGTPLNLPPQSFIYSDTGAMKLDKFELSEMGIDSKKKLTPAEVSKNYQLNKYISILSDPHSDKIANDTAEYMMQKNKESLSQLAFLQEAKKDFEDGVPLASYPYLYNQGIDPIRFSQKVEGLTKQEAEQKALMQLPPEERMKIMKLKEMVQQASQQSAGPQGPPQMTAPQGMPPQQMTEQPMPPQGMAMQPPMAQAAPMPMMRYGGALRKFQGDTGSSEVDMINAQQQGIQNQIDNLNTDTYYNEVLKQIQAAQNMYFDQLDNQEKISNELGANQSLRNSNSELTGAAYNNKNIIPGSEMEFAQDVLKWKKHIEAGGQAPSTINPAYTEAYNQINGNYEFKEEEEENTEDTQAVINNTYITNAEKENKELERVHKQYQDYIRSISHEQVTDQRQNEKQGYAPMNSPLDFQDKSSPYYVGSPFATGDTLETMRYGGSVRKLKRFKKGGQIPKSAFPITNKRTGEVIAANQNELDNLKDSNKALYDRIVQAYGSSTGNASEVPTRTSSDETKKTYKGFNSWSDYYDSDDASTYRDKRYQAYRIVAEKNGMTPLSAEEYHKKYSQYMREVDSFTSKSENDPLYANNPNWDSTYEWEMSDTPCAQGESGCKEYGGNTWRVTSWDKKGQNWYYNQEQKSLGLTEDGESIDPMDAETIQHMQTGMNAGIILQNTGQGEDTYDAPVNFDVYTNEDGTQVDPLSGTSKAEGWAGNNTMFNAEGTYDIVPAEGCTNAAEIQQQCEAQGGTFTPWDPQTQTGCTCEPAEQKEVPEDIIPGEIGKPATLPKPEWWIQDKLKYQNALDNKMSLRKYYPWAPKYNAHLIDPVFKDPTREIAAIGEQAVIAADTASAFSGPQRAAAVQAKAQGKAGQQIADTVNRVQSDNITIANTVAAKNAEIMYKTQVLNNNEAKQLYDNTMLVEQNYDNAMRKANTEITDSLSNAYTNMANTYNLNTLYKNFDILPGTGGMVDITNYDEFNKDPNHQSPQSVAQQYANFKQTMLKSPGVDPDDIPKFQEWYETIFKSGQGVPNNDAQAVLTGGYARRGGEFRDLRLAQKGMELKNFLTGV